MVEGDGAEKRVRPALEAALAPHVRDGWLSAGPDLARHSQRLTPLLSRQSAPPKLRSRRGEADAGGHGRAGLGDDLPDDVGGRLRPAHEADALSGPERHGLDVAGDVRAGSDGVVAVDRADYLLPMTSPSPGRAPGAGLPAASHASMVGFRSVLAGASGQPPSNRVE